MNNVRKTIILILTLNSLVLFSQPKKQEIKKFDDSLLELRALHNKQYEGFTSETAQPQTFPILFAFGNSYSEDILKTIDPKNQNTNRFKKEYYMISESINSVDDYINFGFDNYLELIRKYLPRETLNYEGEKLKIGKLNWQMGYSHSWSDCPVEPTFSQIHGENLCVMNHIDAYEYCTNYGGRLPTIKEFEDAFKKNKDIMNKGRWPKYWTSSLKDKLPAHISISDFCSGNICAGSTIGNDSQSSVRCVWEK